eukprot:6487182-Amphidinium_carterae.1
MGPALPLTEAHIKSELLTGKVLPDEFVEHAAIVKVNTLAEILEACEVMLRSTQDLALVERATHCTRSDVHGKPDTLRLYLAIQPLLQSIISDSQFAVAHANILAVTNVRTHPDPDSLWKYIELLQSELNER